MRRLPGVVRAAVAADAESIAPRLAEAELAQIASLELPLAPVAAAARICAAMIAASPGCAWSWEIDGRLWAVGGAAPRRALAMNAEGAAWLFADREIGAHRFAFRRHAPAMLDAMLARYPLLTAWATASSATNLGLLRHLGFAIGEPVPFTRPPVVFCEARLERALEPGWGPVGGSPTGHQAAERRGG